MIRHIVFFTVPNEADREAVRAGLSILAEIPYARTLEIADNVKKDHFGNAVDIVVYGEFDDEAALAAYKAHPNYQRSIERVRPIRDMRIAADFDTAKAVGRKSQDA